MNESGTGVIGLGAMGAPMARNLAKHGLLNTVWNRTHSNAQTLARELGVNVSASPADLAAHSPLILTCVSADADLEQVIDDCLPGISRGTIVIDTSTVNPATSRKMAQRLGEKGASMIDAPVSGGVEGAIAGTLSVMAGGDSADLERIRPVLEAISARITHMGEVGSGQATKAVNQVMVGGLAQAVCEGLALAEKLNLPSRRLLTVLGAGAAGNWFLEKRGQTMMDDRFEPGFKSALLLKDLLICRSLAQELDVDLPMMEETIRDYQTLVDADAGQEDTSALIRLKRGQLTGSR